MNMKRKERHRRMALQVMLGGLVMGFIGSHLPHPILRRWLQLPLALVPAIVYVWHENRRKLSIIVEPPELDLEGYDYWVEWNKNCFLIIRGPRYGDFRIIEVKAKPEQGGETQAQVTDYLEVRLVPSSSAPGTWIVQYRWGRRDKWVEPPVYDPFGNDEDGGNKIAPYLKFEPVDVGGWEIACIRTVSGVVMALGELTTMERSEQYRRQRR